jgi:hypothetical protein
MMIGFCVAMALFMGADRFWKQVVACVPEADRDECIRRMKPIHAVAFIVFAVLVAFAFVAGLLIGHYHAPDRYITYASVAYWLLLVVNAVVWHVVIRSRLSGLSLPAKATQGILLHHYFMYLIATVLIL